MMTTAILKAPPLLKQFNSTTTQKRKKVQKFNGSNTQQAARSYLAILEEHCPVDSEDVARLLVYQELTDLIKKIGGIREVPTPIIKTINPLPKTVENTEEDWEEIFYNEYESPEITNAFVDVVKNMPILDEQSYSIYSDEELDNF